MRRIGNRAANDAIKCFHWLICDAMNGEGPVSTRPDSTCPYTSPGA